MRFSIIVLAGLVTVLTGPVVAPEAQAADGFDLLPAAAQGRAALRLLGDDVDLAATRSGLAPALLSDVLASDRTAWVDPGGRLFYVEPAQDADAALAPATEVAANPYDQTFALHSRPSATRVIYLDFDGYDVHDTAWNAAGTPALTVPAYTLDDNAAFSTAELDVVQEVWARVAEDYAPFDVDVTTQDPGVAGLARSSAEDVRYGARASITTQTSLRSTIVGCGGGCAGVAYVGTFDTIPSAGQNPEYYQPAFVLPTRGYSAAFVAEIVSHEVGHTLGLAHDGLGSSAYYQDPTGTKIWSPVMGAGYTPLTQFSNGDYAGSTNTQDDLAVIATHGPAALTDDYGSTLVAAFPLDPGATSVTGLIGTRTDLDVFRVDRPCAGPLSATLTTATLGPGLDSRLRLLDAAGVPLAVSSPPTARLSASSPVLVGMSSAVSPSVPAGTYYLEVDGVGLEDANLGYSDYGSVGRYSLAISGCVTGVAGSTVPGSPVVSVAERDDAQHGLRLVWDAAVSDGGSPITGYRLTLDGGSAVTVPSGQRSYTFTGLASQVSYVVGVAATNLTGTGSATSRTVTTGTWSVPATPDPQPPTPGSRPRAPRLGAVTPGADGGARTLTVSWRPPSTTPGVVVTGYRVTVWRVRGHRLVRLSQHAAPAAGRRLTLVLSDADYTVAVTARSALGWGEASTRSRVVRAR